MTSAIFFFGLGMITWFAIDHFLLFKALIISYIRKAESLSQKDKDKLEQELKNIL